MHVNDHKIQHMRARNDHFL